MKRLLTYGLLLLTILASHFVVSACQDDLPETTEVMMTFTTRALVTQEDVSKAIEQEQMKDLRVIMVRQNGSIIHNHKVENITESSVTVTFQTPVLPDGETFKFFAIANEGDLVPDLNLESITSGEISSLITQKVGGDAAFAITNAIPQTQYWEHHIDV
jgi:cell division protein FtsL